MTVASDTEVPDKAEIENKILKSKQYFVFKFYNYFLNGNNLICKRSESFRLLMREIIEIHTEIRLAKNTSDVSRLNKALEYLFKELSFIIQHNPLFKHSKLTKDFTQLNSLITPLLQAKNKKQNEDETISTFRSNAALTSLSSLYKKVQQSELIDYHFDIILNQTDPPLHFDKIDYLIDSLVNESLFIHSPKHLKEWIERYSKQYPYDASNPDNYIKSLKERFIEENFTEKERFFIFKVQIPKSVLQEFDLAQAPFLLTPEKIREQSNEIINFSKIENHLLPKKEGIFYIKRSISSADKYKASDILVEKINQLLEIYKLIGEREGFEINQKGLYKEDEKDKWEFMDVIHKVDVTSHKITHRDKDDIRDFIGIRNKKLLNEEHNELFLLERAYSLISNSRALTLENQLLNTWLAIEHMVTPYISDAIIEKIRQIIPKVVSLYYIKGRMNELWDEINEFQRSEHNDFLGNFLNDCRQAGSSKYEKSLFGMGLKDKDKALKLIEVAGNNINIVRIVMELNGTLNNFDSVKKKVTHINDSIINDLNRIYRTRNKIVHSGVNLPENLNLISLRLLNYNIRLMGTIIHYMKERDNINIEDVLNSIVETYNWYTEDKTKGLSLKEIISPEYLYL